MGAFKNYRSRGYDTRRYGIGIFQNRGASFIIAWGWGGFHLGAPLLGYSVFFHRDEQILYFHPLFHPSILPRFSPPECFAVFFVLETRLRSRKKKGGMCKPRIFRVWKREWRCALGRSTSLEIAILTEVSGVKGEGWGEERERERERRVDIK